MLSNADPTMYETRGVDSVATISELRAHTTDVLAHVREHGEAVLVQRNNDPFAVLIDWDRYKQLMGDLPTDVDNVGGNGRHQ